MIYPNVRGSSGFGKTFLKLDNGFKREDSYKDIAALLDWVKTQPDLDSERVMVTGGSYGGHMTLAIAAFYPERIRCAVEVVGISNLVTFLENTSGYRQDLRRVEYGDERDPKMRRFMLRIAPLNHSAKIRKPLFIIQGANDPRVPLSEAEQMRDTLKKAGVPVWYLVARDEGHGFAKKKQPRFPVLLHGAVHQGIPAEIARQRKSGPAQPSLLQDDHTVGQAAHLARVVADEQDTQAQALKNFFELQQDAPGGQVVQAGKGLVQHQIVGFHDQGPGQDHALQFAAGQFVGPALQVAFRQLQQGECGPQFFKAPSRSDSGDAQRFTDDRSDRETRVHRQERILEHHLVGLVEGGARYRGQRPPAVDHPAAVRPLQAEHDPGQCRFAGPGPAGQGADLMPVNFQVDAVQGPVGERAAAGAVMDIGLADIVQPEADGHQPLPR